MNRFTLAVFAVFCAFPALAFDANCFSNVKSTFENRMKLLKEEHTLPLSEDFLWSDPRFRNFPAISHQSQLTYCPTMETWNAVINFHIEIGFSRKRLDRYLKRSIFLDQEVDPEAVNKPIAVRRYQIGESWDRQGLDPEAIPAGIVTDLLSAFGVGIWTNPNKENDISVQGAIYLGSYQGKGVFSLPFHSLVTEDSDDKVVLKCEDFKFLLPATKSQLKTADGTLLILPEADMVFCSVPLGKGGEKMAPVVWKWSDGLKKSTRLAILGVGRHNNPDKNKKLTYDISEECVALADASQAVNFDNVAGVTSWRLPMGCDISSGDSGSAVVDLVTGRWAGMVTTTNEFTFAALGKKVFSNELPYEILMLETSHLMPLNKLQEALISAKSTASAANPFVDWLLGQGAGQ